MNNNAPTKSDPDLPTPEIGALRPFYERSQLQNILNSVTNRHDNRFSQGLSASQTSCILPLCAVRLIHIKALKYSLTQHNSRKRIGMQCHGPLHLHRYSLKHSLKTPFRPQIHKATFRTLAYLDPHRIEASQFFLFRIEEFYSPFHGAAPILYDCNITGSPRWPAPTSPPVVAHALTNTDRIDLEQCLEFVDLANVARYVDSTEDASPEE
ncbi:uncharacterized protein ARMOST_02502 [Armillaria ostoyae]|uniref:Uncharacterized protein n=1 Tax=Armillaria ostoyae TaxID=47428 RepID=A0A284QS44_ARMOS|nr:uncharacterized protein ARMOST_02502 [Armillaria ostoyae]